MARRQEGPSTATIFRVVFTAAVALTLVSLIAIALFEVRHVLVLVLVAAFLAVGLDPAVRRLHGWGLRRGHAVAVILLAAMLVLVGFLAAVVPPLVRQVTEFAQSLPEVLQRVAERNPRIESFLEEQDIATRLQDALSGVPQQIGGSIGGILGVAGSVVGTIFNVVTVIVLTVYFSISLQQIREGTLRLVPRSKRDRAQELADPILTKIGAYIGGNVVISLIAGVCAFVFLAIVQVPFPVALALWVAIADLIPMVGATLGAIPAVVVAFFVSPAQGVATLVYFIVYQQVENYVIHPRVMTRAVDLSPAAVLLSALIGGSLLGVLGVLMAVPATAAIKLLVQELVVPEADKA